MESRFRETRGNVGYSLDDIIIVQAEHSDLGLDHSRRGGGGKRMDETHFSWVQ